MKYRTPLLSIWLLLLSSVAHAEPVLEIDSPWIQAGPPTSRVLAGFMQARNPGQQAVTITAIESDAFERVEIHRTRYENNMARMQALEKLSLKPGDQVRFEHGGHHLMLFKPVSALQPGQQVSLRFKYTSGQSQDVTFTVQATAGTSHEHHHHH